MWIPATYFEICCFFLIAYTKWNSIVTDIVMANARNDVLIMTLFYHQNI